MKMIGGSMKDTTAKDQCLCNAGGESPGSNRMRMEARLVEKPQEIVRARSSTGNYSRAAQLLKKGGAAPAILQ